MPTYDNVAAMISPDHRFTQAALSYRIDYACDFSRYYSLRASLRGHGH